MESKVAWTSWGERKSTTTRSIWLLEFLHVADFALKISNLVLVVFENWANSNNIYCGMKEAEYVLKTVSFSEQEEENDLETVMIKFKAHFIFKTTTHKKTMFHLIAQRPGERITIFARAFHEFADSCNLRNKGLIYFRTSVRQRLELKVDLFFEIGRSYEQIKTKREERQTNIYEFWTKGVKFKKFSHWNRRCNRVHDWGQYSVKSQTYKKCNRLNHFTVCCRTKISNIQKIKCNIEKFFFCSLTEEIKMLDQ